MTTNNTQSNEVSAEETLRNIIDEEQIDTDGDCLYTLKELKSIALKYAFYKTHELVKQNRQLKFQNEAHELAGKMYARENQQLELKVSDYEEAFTKIRRLMVGSNLTDVIEIIIEAKANHDKQI